VRELIRAVEIAIDTITVCPLLPEHAQAPGAIVRKPARRAAAAWRSS
jgi:uncharacterized membrane protein (DUF4010 family)